MALNTGRQYEIVFGPDLKLGSGADVDAIDLTFDRISAVDPAAITVSVATEGLKVIGSDSLSAIDAGRAVCSIRCQVFDRRGDRELTSESESARAGPPPRAWLAPKRSSFEGKYSKPQMKRTFGPARAKA